MIFGIPVDLLIKDNLIGVFEKKEDTIYYYPSEQGMNDRINIVSQIQLRYDLNPVLEFANIDKHNKLLDRENEVANNIKNDSIYRLTSYNILHKTFNLSSI